jgi:hypothetical protein
MHVDAGGFLLVGDQLGGIGRRLHQRERRPPLAEAAEDLAHLLLEHVAAVEDEVGLAEAAHVARRRLVFVRVGAGPHQRGDGDAVAADILGDVGDHADGGDYGERLLGRRRRARGDGELPPGRRRMLACEMRWSSRAPLCLIRPHVGSIANGSQERMSAATECRPSRQQGAASRNSRREQVGMSLRAGVVYALADEETRRHPLRSWRSWPRRRRHRPAWSASARAPGRRSTCSSRPRRSPASPAAGRQLRTEILHGTVAASGSRLRPAGGGRAGRRPGAAMPTGSGSAFSRSRTRCSR